VITVWKDLIAIVQAMPVNNSQSHSNSDMPMVSPIFDGKRMASAVVAANAITQVNSHHMHALSLLRPLEQCTECALVQQHTQTAVVQQNSSYGPLCTIWGTTGVVITVSGVLSFYPEFISNLQRLFD